MNPDDITDVQELKALMADQFVERERALQIQQQCTNNINVLSARITELEEQEAKKKK